MCRYRQEKKRMGSLRTKEKYNGGNPVLCRCTDPIDLWDGVTDYLVRGRMEKKGQELIRR